MVVYMLMDINIEWSKVRFVSEVWSSLVRSLERILILN